LLPTLVKGPGYQRRALLGKTLMDGLWKMGFGWLNAVLSQAGNAANAASRDLACNAHETAALTA
jgi:hypothetical protein